MKILTSFTFYNLLFYLGHLGAMITPEIYNSNFIIDHFEDSRTFSLSQYGYLISNIDYNAVLYFIFSSPVCCWSILLYKSPDQRLSPYKSDCQNIYIMGLAKTAF